MTHCFQCGLWDEHFHSTATKGEDNEQFCSFYCWDRNYNKEYKCTRDEWIRRYDKKHEEKKMKDEIIKFEEQNWQELSEEFIEKNAESWGEFVMEKFTDYWSAKCDHDYEMAKDMMLTTE